MSDRLRVAAIGTVIDIEAPGRDPRFLEQAREAWADAVHDADGDADAVVVDRADLDDAAALAMLSTDVTLAALAERRGAPLWMLHAAGLAADSGKVVVLSAASGTGKTTAARHLSRRYAYVSDETVAITADGTVVPYRKPLSVIVPESPHKVQVAPSALHGSRPLPDGLRVARIVVLDRRADGPDVPVVERLDLATALELLAPQTSYLSDMTAPLHLIRHLLESTGGAVRIAYREVATLDPVIDGLLDAGASEVASADDRATDAHGVPGADDDGIDQTADGYERTPVVDALDLADGRIAVLRRSAAGSRLHVLDGIGPVIWSAAQGRTIEAITDEVVAAHGEPAGADALGLVRAAVAQLIADDLLRRRANQT